METQRLRNEVHLRLEEVAVDPDALASLLTREERSHDSTVSVQTRRDVGRGYADLGRRAVRFTGAATYIQCRTRDSENKNVHVHQTGLRLDNNIVPCRCAVRAGLAYTELETSLSRLIERLAIS
jgi:hypothetical protein